jgi:transposase
MSVRHLKELVAQKRATGFATRRSSTRRIDAAVWTVLERLRQEDPSATRQQLAERLAEQTGVYVNPHTVGDRLKKLGYTYQRLPSSARKPRPAEATPPTKRYRPSGAGPAGYPTSYFRRAYPSDLTDSQWELIASVVPTGKPGGRPTAIQRRELVNAMLYVLHTGCPWRALPHDLPHWSTVYDYFQQWRDNGVWEKIVGELFQRARRQQGRCSAPSAAAMDAQSVPTTEKGGSVGLTASSASTAASASASWTRMAGRYE